MVFDLLTLFGLIIGLGAILMGQYFEGGHYSALINEPALLIVLGGSIGAIMVQSPIAVFLRSLSILKWIFLPPQLDSYESVNKIVSWSDIARREGLLGLEAVSENEEDPFARRGLQLLVDGNEPETIRAILEVEVETRERFDLSAARIYESMGGYTPTIGIIGAVLGLIQVMENLADPSLLGHGIAVAFVATIYGVGLANLVLLPISQKLKSVIRGLSQHDYMVVEGIVSIAEGENPRSIEYKLIGFIE
ncbi:MAG: flagellar motor protein [Gammaproteobacteria bacterium]|nr:flagellar motor protein [Gammaproteobacteria bacterium]